MPVTATAGLFKLREPRAQAAAQVDDLERKQREVVVAAQQVSAELAEAVRVGASATKTAALESRLAEAKALAAEPWSERISGHRQRVRDAGVAIRKHVQANLTEVAEPVEADRPCGRLHLGV